MPELKFVLAGKQSDLAAAALVSALGAEDVEARRQPVTEASDAERKVVDPISLASLILSIPTAVLACHRHRRSIEEAPQSAGGHRRRQAGEGRTASGRLPSHIRPDTPASYRLDTRPAA